MTDLSAFTQNVPCAGTKGPGPQETQFQADWMVGLPKPRYLVGSGMYSLGNAKSTVGSHHAAQAGRTMVSFLCLGAWGPCPTEWHFSDQFLQGRFAPRAPHPTPPGL